MTHTDWKNLYISDSARRSLTVIAVWCLLVFSVQIVFARSVNSETNPFAKCWTYTAVSDLSTSMAADAGNVYFVDLDRRLHAVDVKLGKKIWSSELGGEMASDLLVLEDAILVATRMADPAQGEAGVGAKLHWISKQTGVTNWTAALATSLSVTLGTMNGSLLAIGDEGHIAVFQVGSPSHSQITHRKGAALSTRPYFDAGAVLFGNVAKEVVRFRPDNTMSVLAKLDHLPAALASNERGELLVGDDRGNLQLLSSGGNSEWKFKNGARISHIVQHDSEFIVASHDNFIYKLTRGGDVDWKRRLPGRIFHRLVVTGDVVVVSVVGDGAVYVIDARTGKVINRIDVGNGNAAGVAGTRDAGSFVIAGPEAVSLYSSNPCQAEMKKAGP